MKKLKIHCNKTFNKNEIKNLIEWFLLNFGTIRTTKLFDKLKIIGFRNATKAGISLGLNDLQIPKIKNILVKTTKLKLKKINIDLSNGKINVLEKLERNLEYWNLTNEIMKNEVIKNFRQTNLLNPVYIMIFSGARGNLSQIKQLVGMRGLISDAKGEVINIPIKSNLKEGLNITEYFISCYGARKGLIDTAIKTANSGYLTRRLIYTVQDQIIKKPNCNSKKGILILNSIMTKKQYNLINEKLIGRVLAKNIIKNKKIIATEGQDICKFIAKKIIQQKFIYIRSLLNCKLNKGICQLCYGWYMGNGRMVELGENIGIIAAQSIGEPGTQLTMRTFHTGGVFSGEITETLNAPINGIIKYKTKKNGKKIKTKHNKKSFLTLKKIKIKILKNKINKKIIKIPKYTVIYTIPNEKVFEKQIIGETFSWKNLNNNNKKKIEEIKTSISGEIYTEKNKKKYWILIGNLYSYNLLFRKINKNNLKINKIYKNQKLKKYKKPKVFKEKSKKNIQNLKLTYKKIENLKKNNQKEKSKKKEYKIIKKLKNKKQILIEKNKKIKFLKIKNNFYKLGEFILKKKNFEKKIKNNFCGQLIQTKKNHILLKKIKPYFKNKKSKTLIKNKNLVKKDSSLFTGFFYTQKTKDIVQGLPKIEELLEARKKNNIHNKLKKIFEKKKYIYNLEIANKKSIEKIQSIIIKKIKNIYESQGISISEKHFEIIVKKMTSKVIIKKEGNSKLIPGEIVEFNKIKKLSNKKIKYEPIILGITKTSLKTESFISNACFQETTQILIKSAIEGKIDWLYGLKENLVFGNLIPVGTGFKK